MRNAPDCTGAAGRNHRRRRHARQHSPQQNEKRTELEWSRRAESPPTAANTTAQLTTKRETHRAVMQAGPAEDPKRSLCQICGPVAVYVGPFLGQWFVRWPGQNPKIQWSSAGGAVVGPAPKFSKRPGCNSQSPRRRQTETTSSKANGD